MTRTKVPASLLVNQILGYFRRPRVASLERR